MSESEKENKALQESSNDIKIGSQVVDLDNVGDLREKSEVNLQSSHKDNSTKSTVTNLSKRRYLDRKDDSRTIKAATDAATNDPYEIKEVMARGAEAVLYRSVCGAFTFCCKSIRNNWNKILGTAASNAVGEKLDDVKYSTKVRHIKNEFAVSQTLKEDGPMPLVRIYAVRQVRRFGIELGYDLLMEYLSGHDLSNKILSKVLPLEDKVRVIYQAAQALGFMHRKKLIHLDIKPSNFMLVEGKVKLIDFGVSVPSGHKSQAITGTGGYMSPEQVCKDIIDERTDIFALGVAFSVFFGGHPLQQNAEDLKLRSKHEEARYHMEHSDTSAILDIPALQEMPLVADVVRSCTIMRRDKRMPNCTVLVSKLRESAEKYGIVLN